MRTCFIDFHKQMVSVYIYGKGGVCEDKKEHVNWNNSSEEHKWLLKWQYPKLELSS